MEIRTQPSAIASNDSEKQRLRMFAAKRRRLAAAVVLGTLLLNALVSGMFALSAMQSYDQFVESSKIIGMNLAQTMEKGLDAKAAVLRSSQNMIVGALEDNLKRGELDPDKIKEVLGYADRQTESLQALRVYDENGTWLFGPETDRKDGAPAPSIAERPYFKEAKAAAHKEYSVGSLALGSYSGEYTMVFAAPYHRPDGSFAGVVTTRFTAKMFYEMLRDLRPNDGDAFIIRDSRDYSLLARQPKLSDKPGGKLGSKNIPKGVAKLVESGLAFGSIMVGDTTDGEARTTSYVKLSKYPIIVLAGIGHKGHFAPWQRQAQSYAVFCIAFLAFSAGIAFALFRYGSRALVAESHAQELNSNLEAQVEERGRALEASRKAERAAQKELAEAERLASLGAMVAGVAHELNTPLGNSLLSSTALTEQADDLASYANGEGLKKSVLASKLANISELARIQSQSIERAAELVKSFKQVAVDQTSGKRREFDLAETIQSVVATFKPTLARSEIPIEVRVDIPSGIICDTYPGALIQISTNMLQNAWRHAFEGKPRGLLRIAASIERDDDRSFPLVIVKFSDDGVGMTPEVWSRAFEPYFTTKNASGGSGVGLSLSRQLAETVLLGKLEARPSSLGGVEFTLSFPIARPTD